MMYNYGYDGFVPFGMFGFGGVFMILFWVLVLYGIIWFFRKESVSNSTHTKGNALEILKERYVKGEITKHQFEEMKKDIGH
ncbi:SHOCT domain-containing protein [Patescibacteria group bacterium]|nr:MAG: SHOCT domain-containing protein [Patescibacteria group bacterium]